MFSLHQQIAALLFSCVLLLTVNFDLCLLNLRCVSAGDVAAIRASVIGLDLVDGQDATNFRGFRQSFTVGPNFRPAVCLVTRTSLKI